MNYLIILFFTLIIYGIYRFLKAWNKKVKEEQLKERLINRKIKGGVTPQEALKFYKRSDKKNVKRVMENRIDSDVVLKLKDSNEYEKIKGEF